MHQVVLFLLSTKDITESYTASRGPSIYSMESDPVANDENKVNNPALISPLPGALEIEVFSGRFFVALK